MRTLVMKFGGSSVVDASAIERVERIVAMRGTPEIVPVVVVSALGGVTDALLSLAAAARGGDAAAVSDGINALMGRHFDLATQLAVPVHALQADYDRAAEALRAALDAIQLRRSGEPASLDTVAATGELLSSRLVAAAMVSKGLNAAWVDARDVVMTDDRYTCAAPLAEETNAAAQRVLQPLVDAAIIPVLGGFIG